VAAVWTSKETGSEVLKSASAAFGRAGRVIVCADAAEIESARPTKQRDIFFISLNFLLLIGEF
jgi:hypothetical protein